jgi:hypothetical protein
MKYCCSCDQWKNEEEFGVNNSTKSGLASYCKECERARVREYKKSHPEVIKAQRKRYNNKNQSTRAEYRLNNKDIIKNNALQRSFGITMQEYLNMYMAQNGKCAICNQEAPDPGRSLGVDHDHTTNKIRGLLCMSCNMGLGNYKDDIQLLKNAIVYLENGGFRARE